MGFVNRLKAPLRDCDYRATPTFSSWLSSYYSNNVYGHMPTRRTLGFLLRTPRSVPRVLRPNKICIISKDHLHKQLESQKGGRGSKAFEIKYHQLTNTTLRSK